MAVKKYLPTTRIGTGGIVSRYVYTIAFVAVPAYTTDGDALSGLASALQTTAKLAVASVKLRSNLKN